MKKILLSIVASIFIVFSFAQNSFSYSDEYSDIADRVFQKLESRYADYSDIKKMIFYNYLIVKLDKISQEIDNYEIKQIIVHLKRKLVESSDNLTSNTVSTASDLDSSNVDVGTSNVGTSSETCSYKWVGKKLCVSPGISTPNLTCNSSRVGMKVKDGTYGTSCDTSNPGIVAECVKTCSSSENNPGTNNNSNDSQNDNQNDVESSSDREYYGECSTRSAKKMYYFTKFKTCRATIFECDSSVGKYYMKDASWTNYPAMKGTSVYNTQKECIDAGRAIVSHPDSGSSETCGYKWVGKKLCVSPGISTPNLTCNSSRVGMKVKDGTYGTSCDTSNPGIVAECVNTCSSSGNASENDNNNDNTGTGSEYNNDSNNNDDNAGNSYNREYYGKCSSGVKVRKYYEVRKLRESYCSNTLFTCDTKVGRYYQDAGVVVSPGPGTPVRGADLYDSYSACKRSLSSSSNDSDNNDGTSANNSSETCSYKWVGKKLCVSPGISTPNLTCNSSRVGMKVKDGTYGTSCDTSNPGIVAECVKTCSGSENNPGTNNNSNDSQNDNQNDVESSSDREYYGECSTRDAKKMYYFTKFKTCRDTIFECDTKVGKYYMKNASWTNYPAMKGTSVYNTQKECVDAGRAIVSHPDSGSDNNNSVQPHRTYYGKCSSGVKVRKYYELHSLYGSPKRCSNTLFTCDTKVGRYYQDAGVVVSPGPGIPANGADLYDSYSACKRSLTSNDSSNFEELKAVPSNLIMNLSHLNVKNYVTTNIFGVGPSDLEICLAAITHFNPKVKLGVTCDKPNAKYYRIKPGHGWKYLGGNKWSFTTPYSPAGFGTKGGTNVRVYFRNKNNPSKNAYFSILTVGTIGPRDFSTQ